MLILCCLLPELGRFVQIAFKVPPELARSQEASLQPVKLIKDCAERHGHALFDLLADTLNHALGVDRLTNERLEEHSRLCGHSAVAGALTPLHVVA